MNRMPRRLLETLDKRAGRGERFIPALIEEILLTPKPKGPQRACAAVKRLITVHYSGDA